MQIAMIGINHKSGSLFTREEVTRYFLKRFRSSVYIHLFPSVLLSTCLRSELYFSGEDLLATHHYLLSLLRQRLTFPNEKMLYSFFGADCFFHLAGVTAGLDSLEVGECEIKRQVKEAYLDATLRQKLSPELHFLFQKSLKLSKDVRREFSFPKEKTLLSAFCEKIEETFPDKAKKKYLFIGASEIHQKVVRFLKSKGNFDLTFCNRTEEKAKTWAKKEGAKVLTFGKWDPLFDYDIISFATKSEEFLLTSEMIPPIDSKKLIFDLSFPRNVDPKVNGENLTLFTLEELISSGQSEKIESQPLLSLVQRQIDLFEKKQTLPSFRHYCLNQKE